jgi:hypothetical protein
MPLVIGVRSRVMFRVEARAANISDPHSGTRSVVSKPWNRATDVEQTSPAATRPLCAAEKNSVGRRHGTNVFVALMTISLCDLSEPQIGQLPEPTP